MINTNNFEKAYSEVLEILKYIPLNDYNKIPQKYIKHLEENCDENSEFVYNVALPFDKQEISENAKDILGMILKLFIKKNEK